MRVLLDTNILIHREAATVVREDIGVLFNWLDRLGNEKCVHPASVREIEKHRDERIRRSFRIKLESYRLIQIPSPLHADVASLSARVDSTANDRIDTALLNEVFVQRVDFLISEDRGLASKAQALGIGHRVFTIDAFLEKVTAENPALVDYRVLSVRKVPFGEVNLEDEFFDSFREDYPGFDQWFIRKSDEPAYVSEDSGKVVAFLYVKVEERGESYADIRPSFPPKRRLKIGTFKVELNGYKLGERFLKIIFDNAVSQRVDEIYVTIFPKTIGQQRLIKLLEEFGFIHHGEKLNSFGVEQVYVRGMAPSFNAADPKLTYSYFSRSAPAYIVPIYPQYHTALLPDSILNNESPINFVEQEPHRNAIRKVYVSRSLFRDLRRGDTIVFYRTGGFYKSVVTTIGIVDGVYKSIGSEEEFIDLCRKRSVFSDEELREHWRYDPRNRPFIVGFLYAYAFPQRPNLKALIENGVIANVDSAPRGFERFTQVQLDTILNLAGADLRLVVD